MTPNPLIINSVEKLGYRVTVGDVASFAGLEINLAQQGLLALASESGGNLQVAESGDIVYLFPKNFRSILRNKYWRIRLQEWWAKVWKVLFYLIRISFGIILIISILLMFVAILAIVVASSLSRDENSSSGGGDRSSGGGGSFFYPNFWISPDFFWFFDFNNNQNSRQPNQSGQRSEMNFLESIFSFLFGDGNPNIAIEEQRWQEIGSMIRSNGGAVIAQQVSPYFDQIAANSLESEDYMLGVLARFDGYPEVSPEGGIIYYFPSLQTTAKKRYYQPVKAYLQENIWRFSRAGSGQIMMAIGLGAVNIILALVLGSLLQGNLAIQIGSLIGFVNSIYWLLLAYGIGFLTIPLIRYFWIQWKNSKIATRNSLRQQRAIELNEPSPDIQQKIAYARQFATEKIIDNQDLAYTTETDLIEQDIEDGDKIDDEWRRRLSSGS